MHAPVSDAIPPDMLLLAYRSGIFPMADSRDDPEIFWVEPRMRASATAILTLTMSVLGMTLGPITAGWFSDIFAAQAFACDYAARCGEATTAAASRAGRATSTSPRPTRSARRRKRTNASRPSA